MCPGACPKIASKVWPATASLFPTSADFSMQTAFAIATEKRRYCSPTINEVCILFVIEKSLQLRCAQVWCAQNTDHSFCNSGGINWAVSPVGNASSVDVTQWAPKAQCSCLKNCACSASTCWCAGNMDKTPIGQAPNGQNPAGLDFKMLNFSRFGSNQNSKRGMCACSCGGVLGI